MSLLLAREKLSPNNLEAGLPGREFHSGELYNFLLERLKVRRMKIATNIKGKHMNKTMFVCGVPGTGKTATILYTIQKLSKLLSQKNPSIHSFQHVYINGQLIASPDKIYSEMLYKLTKQVSSSEKAQDKLDKIFKESKEYKIIIIDELDLLYSDRRQSVFYNLFDWPTTSDSKMILIAIANAMDLPERFMRGRIFSRLGWNKLVFESYTSDCLEKILKVRLGQDLLNKTFEKTAIMVATKRVGRTTGDARRILDTCRLAIDKAIELKKPKVTTSIIDQVGFQNLDIQRVNYLTNCKVLHLFTLKCILKENASNGEENVTSYGVYRQLDNLLSQNTKLRKYKVGFEEYSEILHELVAVGLIHLESNKSIFTKKVMMKDLSEAFCEQILKEPGNFD